MILKKVIVEAKQGDHDAFKKIFDHMNDRLFIYANIRASSRDDALDIVQDTFVDLWRGLVTFTYESDEAFYGFVFIILKRKLYSHRRQAQKKASFDSIEQDHMYVEVPTLEDTHDMRKCLESLKPKHRKLIQLRYWLGLPFKEIASTMHVKETTAKVWHHRALQKMRVHSKNHSG